MMQSEHILEYLDGALDPAAEQQLFEMLAGHPELRSTLRGYVQISDAVRGDREAFTPPAAVEAALMRQLGFIPAPSTTRTGGWIAMLLGSRGFGLIVAFVLGALLTAGALQVVPEWRAPSTVRVGGVRSSLLPGRAAAATATSSVTAIPVAVGGNGLSGVQPAASHPAVHHTARSHEPTIPNVSVAKTTTPTTNRISRTRFANRAGGDSGNDLIPSSTQAAAREEVTETDLIQPSTSPPVLFAASDAQVFPASVISPAMSIGKRAIDDTETSEYRRIDEPFPLVPVADNRDRRGQFMIEVRRAVSMDLVDVQAREVSGSPFEGSTVGGYVRLTPFIALGAEIGGERYAQRIPFADGDTVAIEQRPMCLWGGAALRIYPREISGFDPIVQGGVGISTAGPIVQGRIGLARELLAGLRLGFGLEVSTLFYNAAGTGQASGRWGGYGGLEVTLPW